MATRRKRVNTVSVAMTGSGGSGVMTSGQMLLEAAGKAGLYGRMTRSSGPQIRGGEAAAFVRLSPDPVKSASNIFDILLAFDWMNIERFAAEIPMDGNSLVICDSAAEEVPEVIRATGARIAPLPLREMAKGVEGGRANMIGLGVVAALIDLPEEAVAVTLEKALENKGRNARHASRQATRTGSNAGRKLSRDYRLDMPAAQPSSERWNISGNEACGIGALRAGVRFVAAYPITPATEILEWLAPNLEDIEGTLVQAEDELASVNMIVGGSFGGVPSLTATSGPGLSLMMESIGLAVAAEIPIVIVDVMRGGPSTGIPVKSEQSDLNIALYGLHGDAPHIVTAPNSIADCLFTTQWSVHLAEALQCPAIVLSDQSFGQSRAIVDRPPRAPFVAERKLARPAPGEAYLRYAVTESGVSPMAIPGTPGGEYVAEGLEHNPRGTPSSQAEDHLRQLDKRERKLHAYDYGTPWADVEGDGAIAVITWGSCTGPAREAVEWLTQEGRSIRLISLRLLAPAQTARFEAAMVGVERVFVVEQTHSRQFHRYLRAHYDLPAKVKVFAQPGPLPIRPIQIYEELAKWK